MKSVHTKEFQHEIFLFYLEIPKLNVYDVLGGENYLKEFYLKECFKIKSNYKEIREQIIAEYLIRRGLIK